MLEAAQLVYNKFWGKNLNDILQPVPNYGDLKYFTEEQIVDLKLMRLLYGETVLLVREEYDVCYNALKDSNSGGVVVTGQPGIGMHLSPTADPAVFFTKNRPPKSETTGRKNVFSILLAVSPFKREKDCRFSSGGHIFSLSRNWRSDTQQFFDAEFYTTWNMGSLRLHGCNCHPVSYLSGRIHNG
jgi:hypothetical protein